MTYVVQVKEINYGVIEVEAENEEQAWELAWDDLCNGEVDWGHCHSDIETIEEAVCPYCGRNLDLHEYVCKGCGNRI